ncbi:MAG: antibiotic biosynthesis monooxygenase [Bacteroidetes bacterium]|nr:MAG: antibiotic biosynthesis monooxygenase [Bacteroidota bacterium]
MLIRLVRMRFRPETLETFEALFAQHKIAIRQVSGCLHLELHGDPGDPLVRYTLSHWDRQADLDAYRKSPLFGLVWPQTKALFSEAPQAYSLVHRETIVPNATQD